MSKIILPTLAMLPVDGCIWASKFAILRDCMLAVVVACLLVFIVTAAVREIRNPEEV